MLAYVDFRQCFKQLANPLHKAGEGHSSPLLDAYLHCVAHQFVEHLDRLIDYKIGAAKEFWP